MKNRKKKEKRGCRAKYGKVLSETQKDRNLIKGINAHSRFLCIQSFVPWAYISCVCVCVSVCAHVCLLGVELQGKQFHAKAQIGLEPIMQLRLVLNLRKSY